MFGAAQGGPGNGSFLGRIELKESTFRKIVVQLLRSYHAVAVENALGSGTPDVYCTLGWIELKSLREWPVREKSPVRLPHFTAMQKHWLSKECACGGKAWLLIKIAREWVLIHGTKVDTVGAVPRDALLALSARHWNKTPSKEELVECLLTNNRPQANCC